MIPLIYYNIVIAIIIGVASLVTAVALFKKNNSREALSLAWFWLLAVGIWILTAVAHLLFGAYGNYNLGNISLYLIQIFVGAHLIPLAYYVVDIVFRKPGLSKAVAFAWFGLFVIFISLIFINGFGKIESSEWGIQGPVEPPAYYVFLIMALPIYVLAVYYAVLHLIYRHIPKYKHASFRLWSIISFLIYGTAGIIDERSMFVDWFSLLVRIVIVAAVLMAYLVYTSESAQKNLGIKNHSAKKTII